MMNSYWLLYSLLVLYCGLCSATDVLRDETLIVHKVLAACVKDNAPEASKCAYERLHWVYPNGTVDMRNFTINFKKAADKCLVHKEKLQTNGKFNFTLFHDCASITFIVQQASLFKDCEKEFGKVSYQVSDETLKKDKKLACVINCVIIKQHAMDAEGNFNMSQIVSKAESGYDIPGIAERCVKRNQQSDACQRGALRYNCLTSAIQYADVIKNRKI